MVCFYDLNGSTIHGQSAAPGCLAGQSIEPSVRLLEHKCTFWKVPCLPIQNEIHIT